jgi:hypothetical protein
MRIVFVQHLDESKVTLVEATSQPIDRSEVGQMEFHNVCEWLQEELNILPRHICVEMMERSKASDRLSVPGWLAQQATGVEAMMASVVDAAKTMRQPAVLHGLPKKILVRLPLQRTSHLNVNANGVILKVSMSRMTF